MSEVIDFGINLWLSAPALLKGSLIVLAGWLSALIIRVIVKALLKLLRFDRFADKIGFSEFLNKGNAGYCPSGLVAALSFWLILALTFLMASRTLDFEVVNQLSDNILSALPSLFAAVFIIVVGVVILVFLANVVGTISKNAGWKHSRLLIKGVRYIGGLLIFILILDQVGLGQSLISSMFLIAFAALAFSLSLAFGLGCKDIARTAMISFLKAIIERDGSNGESDMEG